MLKINVFGQFSVTDETGKDFRPKLLKSRAILAMLVTIDGHRHTRSWFQAHLWGDRGHAQGLASLRGALADIRRHLGPYADALIADHSEIALDPNAFELRDLSGRANTPEFLEGFDIPHVPEFEDWLRSKRQEFHCASALEQKTALPTVQATPVEPALTKSWAAKIYVAPALNRQLHAISIYCDMLVDCLIKSCDDLGLAEAIDGRHYLAEPDQVRADAISKGCDLILFSEAAEAAIGALGTLRIVDVATGRLFWSQTVVLQPDNPQGFGEPEFVSIVANFIDVLTEHQLSGDSDLQNQLDAAQLGLMGISRMFRLGAQNYERADALLEEAYEKQPLGRFLAWRGFLRTFQIGEMEFRQRDVVIEEGLALKRRALEVEPHNSMVLAIAAHIEGMLTRSYAQAYDLSEQALAINRANPLAWATMGLAEAHLRDASEGYEKTRVACQLARSSRKSFVFEAWASIAGVMAGDFDASQAHAELSHAKVQSFAPPLRYLTALYLHKGAEQEADQMLQKLRMREPEFDFASLRESNYPAAGLRHSNILTALPGLEI